MHRLILLLFSLTAVAQDTTRLSLLFLGDIMQHETQLQAAYQASAGTYEYDTCFYFIRDHLRRADLVIGNLELTLGGKPYRGYPQFSAPDELAAALQKAGINVLVTANNHSLDRGRKGLERTIRVLDSLQILHTGTFADTSNRLNDYPLLIERNGIRLALLNYTYGTNGIPVTKPNVVNLIDTVVIARDLYKARMLRADAIVVFMHWGNEYQSHPTSEQKKLAEFCFRKGAMIVVGAHPHVLQPMYWYRERNQLVAYSLGNFISGQREHPRDGAALLQVDLIKTYGPDSVWTSIERAGYLLHWVYRTPLPERRFLVLPVPQFESDTTGFIRDGSSRQAFQQFVGYARRLLGKGPDQIPEITDRFAQQQMCYRIEWEVREDEVLHREPYDSYFGLTVSQIPGGNKVYRAGLFTNYHQAIRYLEHIRRRFPHARLVEVIR